MDFKEWVQTRPPDFWFWGPGSGQAMERASSKGTFKLVRKNVYEYKGKEFIFDPGDTDKVDRHQAWAYVVYTKWCRRKGIEPGPFIDLVETYSELDD